MTQQVYSAFLWCALGFEVLGFTMIFVIVIMLDLKAAVKQSREECRELRDQAREHRLEHIRNRK
jgi:heme exporter protein D